MKSLKLSKLLPRLLALFALSALHSLIVCAAAAETFDLLHVKGDTYRNVRVTGKTKDNVFIVHSGGLANVKVSDLTPELLEKLGYPRASRPHAASTAVPASQAATKTVTASAKKLQSSISQPWYSATLAARTLLALVARPMRILAALMLLTTYFFYCHCCMLICQKTGIRPGIMVWVPLLQVVPLLRAASMSPWWLLVLFVPVLNVIGYAIWCTRIVRACWKTTSLLVLLLLPVTSWFAFVVLAFSETPAPKLKAEGFVEIMGLETAMLHRA